MMKTFEVMIAAVVVMGMIALLSIPQFSTKTKYAEIRKVCERALLSMTDKHDFRALVLSAKDENSLQAVKDYVSEYIEYPFELQICDENDNCLGSKPNVKSFLTVSYLMDGNISDYNVLVIKLYAWLFTSE